MSTPDPSVLTIGPMGRRALLDCDAGAPAREPPRLNARLRLPIRWTLCRDDWSRGVICMRILPEHPFDAESAVLMLDQHFSAATGVTIVFRERDGAANGLRLAGIVPGKASPSLDDLPANSWFTTMYRGLNMSVSSRS